MRRIVKIPLAGISLVMFLLVLLLYLYFFTSVPEQQVNEWLTYYLPEKTGYRITVEKIYRDIWRRLRLEDIRIYRVDDGELNSIGHIQTVEIKYTFKDVLFGEYNFSNLSASDIELALLDYGKSDKVTADTAVSKSNMNFKIPDIAIDNINLQNLNIKTLFQEDTVNLAIPYLAGSFANDGDMMDVKIDSLKAMCPQKDFQIENLSVKSFMVNDNWMIESFDLRTSRSVISINGQLGKPSDPDFQLSYDFSPFDLGDVNSFMGLNLVGLFYSKGHVNGDFDKFGGEMEGSGHLFERSLADFTADFRFADKHLYIDSYDGYLFESPLTGKGYVDFGAQPETYSMSGKIEDLNLQKISPDLYTSFSGYFELSGRGFTSSSFHMDIDMDLSQADVDIYHFDKAFGAIDFDLDDLHFHPGFEAYYKDTKVVFDGSLEYTGEIDLTGDAEFKDLGNFKNQFFITDLDGVGRADFRVTGLTLDFTVDGDFYSDSCRFYGLYADSFDLDLQLKSFISHRVGRIGGRWSGGNLYTVPVDSGDFAVTVSGEKFFLDSVRVENENNKIAFTGYYDNGTIPPSLVIDSTNMVLWKDTVYNKSPLLIDVYEKEVEFQDFKLYSRSSSLEMTGIVTYEGQMALEIKADNLEIKPIAEYFIKDKTIFGLLTGELGVAGNFDSPEFDADIWIHDLSIDDYKLGLLNIRAYYENSLLSLVPAELESPEALYTLTGNLPVNLSFTSDEGFLPQEQMELRLVASGRTVVLAPVFVESIRDFDADFNVDIEIAGTYDKPSARGAYTINNGTLYVMELVEPLRDVTIGGRLVNDKIYVDTLSLYARLTEDSFTKTINEYLRASRAATESGGLITGFGTITILSMGELDYNLNLTGYNCEFYTDGYDTQFLTDLFLTVKGSSPPLVSGWARLKKFEFRDPFAKYATTGSPDAAVLEDTTQWDIKLDVHAANNVWIKNTESIIETEGAASMEMKGDITVTREKGRLGVLGQFDVIRGYYYLANMKFRIQSGWMVFDNPDTLDPLVYIDVTTRIMTPGSGAQVSYTDLDLVISGRLSNLQIGTSEGSAYSDEDILMLLIENMIASGDSENLTESIAFLSQRLISSLDEFEAIDMIDISREHDVGEESKSATRLTVWKYLSPQLLLKYSTRLSLENAGQTVGFEYIFNNNISFEGYQGTADQGVSFDVKLRHEF